MSRISQALDRNDHPDRSWAEDARSSRRVTFRHVGSAVEQWRSEVDRRLAAGPVALLIEDPLRFAVAFVALVAVGRQVAPLDGTAPPADLEWPAGARVVVTDRSPRSLEVAGRQVVTITGDGFPSPRPSVSGAGPARSRVGRRTAPGPPEGSVLLLSSGSSGPRKSVLLDESQVLWTAGAVADHLRLGPTDRGYSPLPLFHVNAEVVGLLASLVSGSTVVLDRGFHRHGFWPLMVDRGITWINAVPAIIAILAHDRPADPPGSGAGSPAHAVRLIRSASAPLASGVLTRFERAFAIPVIESYGMTEAGSQITASPLEGVRRPGSVGLPVATDLRVVDDEGDLEGSGRDGRIQIRGRGVITHYAGPEGNEHFTSDGWLDTGDLGHVDEAGYVVLTGRSSEVINRGGEKVFPDEIEAVLLDDPAVSEAAVIGRADAMVGQAPVAYITAFDPVPGDLVRRLRERCDRSLSRYKRPVEIRLTRALPRNPAGKVSRRLVGELDAAEQRGRATSSEPGG